MLRFSWFKIENRYDHINVLDVQDELEELFFLWNVDVITCKRQGSSNNSKYDNC